MFASEPCIGVFTRSRLFYLFNRLPDRTTISLNHLHLLHEVRDPNTEV